MTRHRGKQQAYTLLELLIVVTLVALVASVALPSLSPAGAKKVDLAASEVADAIRFARSEALRTGEGRGITISQATQRITVKKYDLSTAPISTVGTLIHPIDKTAYDFNINTKSTTRGVTISNTDDVFNFTGLGGRRSLIFDAYGTPKWIVGSGPTTYLLSDGSVELSYGNQRRYVSVVPITGRVTIR